MTTELRSHFIGELWAHGQMLHTHTRRCILCASPDGDTTVHARVHVTELGTGLCCERLGNRLCPDCKVKHLPLTKVMRRHLDKLSRRIWPELMKLGCPCCSGLDWYPSPQVH